LKPKGQIIDILILYENFRKNQTTIETSTYGGFIKMKTTLDLPEDLLLEAMRYTHIETKSKVIITALEELIQKNRISGLKKFKSKVDLDIDMNKLRSRKCRLS
jgi:putative antitoxin of VapBC-like toxin-antitoxin system